MADSQNALDRIAAAFEGIYDELRKAGNRYWPEPKLQRESKVTHVPNEEDKARESLGIDERPIDQWLEDLGDPEGDDQVIGPRTAQWLKDHQEPDARPQAASAPSGPKARRSRKTESKA